MPAAGPRPHHRKGDHDPGASRRSGASLQPRSVQPKTAWPLPTIATASNARPSWYCPSARSARRPLPGRRPAPRIGPRCGRGAEYWSGHRPTAPAVSRVGCHQWRQVVACPGNRIARRHRQPRWCGDGGVRTERHAIVSIAGASPLELYRRICRQMSETRRAARRSPQLAPPWAKERRSLRQPPGQFAAPDQPRSDWTFKRHPNEVTGQCASDKDRPVTTGPEGAGTMTVRP